VSAWWWVPIGLAAWFGIALAVGLLLGPVLRHSSRARDTLDAQMRETPSGRDEPPQDGPRAALQASWRGHLGSWRCTATCRAAGRLASAQARARDIRAVAGRAVTGWRECSFGQVGRKFRGRARGESPGPGSGLPAGRYSRVHGRDVNRVLRMS
jgi:hypothetical protein